MVSCSTKACNDRITEPIRLPSFSTDVLYADRRHGSRICAQTSIDSGYSGVESFYHSGGLELEVYTMGDTHAEDTAVKYGFRL